MSNEISCSVMPYNITNLPSDKMKKIFIITDDLIEIRLEIKNILISIYNKKRDFNKYEFIECQDGIESLYTIYKHSNNDIVCLITDEFMDFMNGTESVRIINDLIIKRKIIKFPIILSTNFLDRENILNIKNYNLDIILNKPVNRKIILEILTKHKLV